MPVLLTTYLAAVAAVFAFCIYVSSHEGTLLNRIMNNALLRCFGVYCYSICLLHFVVLRLGDHWFRLIARTLGIEGGRSSSASW